MFKNMKLSLKITSGFALLLIISLIMGIFAWQGLSKILHLTTLTEGGVQALNSVNQCATARRDFAIRSFAKAEGQTKDAAEQLYDANKELSDGLTALNQKSGLLPEERNLIVEAGKVGNQYRDIFGKIVDAQKAIDGAFLVWRNLGNSFTTVVTETVNTKILPEIQKTLESNNIQELSKWTTIRSSLDEDLVQNFLLLRVRANALVKAENESEYNNYQTQCQVTKDGLKAWSEQIGSNAELQQVVQTIANAIDGYDAAGKSFYGSVVAKQQANAEMAKTAGDIVEKISDLNNKLETRMNSVGAQTNIFLVCLVAGGITIGILLAVVITRAITKPINQIIAGLTEGAQQVASASGQVSAASQSLAEGATEQAAGLEETSSSLEEMSSMTKQNADNAQQANALAAEARTAAQSGAESMQRMSHAIDDIQKSSDQTAKIIKVIDEIAFQTNLLALNAAVEAARAGEAGKGFAVVAEEVRNLAMRSAEAAKNTANMIEESVKNAKNGVEISNEVSKALEGIVAGIAKTTDLVGEIAAASSEQAQGIDQVNTAVAQMDKVTQQNAANAEESASASEELSAQAETMQTIVDELVALVEGASAQGRSRQAAPRRSAAGRTSKPKLGLSDQTFHHIASGKQKTQNKSAVNDPLPLGNDFSDFNG